MPSSKQKKVTVFGAGIAGLTAAHELARLGYSVSVYETNSQSGGFFRSARREADKDIPSEYSWHGIGPWYHNVFDLMKQIPFDNERNLYEGALSRPIDFGIASEDNKAAFDDTRMLNIKNMFRMTWLDIILGSWLMLKGWVADHRSTIGYSKINAAQAWRPYLTNYCWQMWRSSFGPWIGSDWLNVSLHTATKFFRKQLITRPDWLHPADKEGPAWKHGARDGWLLLRGPSNEYWFRRWEHYLESLGVTFNWKMPLKELHYDGNKITSATLSDNKIVEADLFILAVNPFAAADVLDRTPKLKSQKQLCLFRSLVNQEPHNQVSLRIAFSEEIAFPRKRTAIVVASSEFNLTLFAQEQAWGKSVSMGKDVKSLWTVTACVSKVPGRIYKLPLEQCNKEQFVEEVKAQIFDCSGLDLLIKEANNGRSLKDFLINTVEVWHEWDFSNKGIQYEQPKWVNRTDNQQYLPQQKTPVPNLALAGAHTLTDVDVWSIEAAVESGRRAARVFEPSVKVLTQYHPKWLQLLGKVDNVLFSIGMPNLLDVLLFLAVLSFIFSVLTIII